MSYKRTDDVHGDTIGVRREPSDKRLVAISINEDGNVAAVFLTVEQAKQFVHNLTYTITQIELDLPQ